MVTLAVASAAALMAWAWPIVIFLAVACILWWVLQKFPLPSPFNIIVYVLAAVVAIYFLLSIGPPPH